MELNDDQKQAVMGWAEQGMGLSEIQKNLRSELGISLTYMDVRFLVLELGCKIRDRKTAAAPKPPQNGTTDDADSGMHDNHDDTGIPAGGIQVELDRVVKAGAMISGTVIFSDGVNASWAVDNMGRMVLNAGKPDYRPSPEDIQLFQMKLKKLFERRGF